MFEDRRYLIPFRSTLLPQIFCDTLIIGSGVAGLRAAVAAAGSGGPSTGPTGDVIVLCKDEPTVSNTAWAQGGIAAVTGTNDSVEAHIADTLTAGAGLCDEAVVRRIIERGPERIAELITWGMRFDRDGTGGLRLGREGGHGLARILHADGDATGAELQRCLWEQAAKTPGVRLFTRCQALDLVTPGNEPGSPVMGAITHHPRYGLQMIWAKSTILASGGAGVIYRETTNPRTASGDGVAMAWRAGASVADMAFIQFHPTCLYLAGAPRSLITEAIRGEGGLLVDHDGHRFMHGEHPLAELAPRDVVTRAIISRLAARGGTHVFLDARGIKDFARKFPGIAGLLAKFDLDGQRDLIPVHPAAHYTIGGVATDLEGRTDAPGLFAAGECAASGLHGANRLASNSLLEGLVMGEVAGVAARRRAGGVEVDRGLPEGWANPPRPAPVPIVSDIRPSVHGELDLSDVESSLRSAMWRNAGIERTGPRLSDAEDMINFWARYTLDKIFDDTRGWQIQNMLLVASLIVRSAAWREESRGCHWRAEHAGPVDEFLVHDAWRRGKSTPTLRPVRQQAIGARA